MKRPKTSSVLKALAQAGLEVTKGENNFYHIKSSSRHGSFIDQDGSAHCMNSCWNGTESDAMTDYFPETYYYTIKSFVQSFN